MQSGAIMDATCGKRSVRLEDLAHVDELLLLWSGHTGSLGYSLHGAGKGEGEEYEAKAGVMGNIDRQGSVGWSFYTSEQTA